jgi:hypothetical protein
LENIIAVAMIGADGTKFYFLTWGRIFDPVDEEEIIKCVKIYADKCNVSKPIKAGYVCHDLQEASKQMYFYEAFYYMALVKVPSEKKPYQRWKTKIVEELKRGNKIFYLGNPKFLRKKIKIKSSIKFYPKYHYVKPKLPKIVY